MWYSIGPPSQLWNYEAEGKGASEAGSLGPRRGSDGATGAVNFQPNTPVQNACARPASVAGSSKCTMVFIA